jgi:hypothetical protein
VIDKATKFLIILICLSFLAFISWQLGRWYGQAETQSQVDVTGMANLRLDSYNQYLLKNCLRNK